MSLKEAMREQARQFLFDAATRTGSAASEAGKTVANLFQNPGVLEQASVADIAQIKADVESALAGALETFTEILDAAVDLKNGKLPS